MRNSFLAMVPFAMLKYLAQLRDIEILVQQQLEALEGVGNDDETLREIQKILYSTEVREIFPYHNR